MMAERFTTFEFTVPLPKTERRADWVHCPKCCAAFHLHGKHGTDDGASVGAGTPAPTGGVGPLLPVTSATAAAAAAAPGAPEALVNALRDLAALHAKGALDRDEFRAAKRKLLNV